MKIELVNYQTGERIDLSDYVQPLRIGRLLLEGRNWRAEMERQFHQLRTATGQARAALLRPSRRDKRRARKRKLRSR